MKRKWTKREVEQAADVLAAIVSTDGWFVIAEVGSDMGASHAAVDLADRAWCHVAKDSIVHPLRNTNIEAEAESLLRTGWLP